MNRAIVSILAFVSLLLFAVPGGTSTPFTDHYVPKAGDGFSYVETTNLDGGIGNYTGYTETSTTTGSETVVSVAPNGTANATWNYTTHWRNNTGSSQQWSSGGRFSFSTATFDYIHGTDNQSGENGSHVWFWMNTSLPVGSSFYPLQTQLTVVSDNTSYHLGNNPGKWVATIYAEGSGSFPRNDVYGKFTATYTTQYYFDPGTGYIVGFAYTEQDRDSSGDGFTYTDTFNTTTTSYPLTAGTPPSSPASSPFSTGLLLGIAVLVILLIVIVLIVVVARSSSHRRLPTHSLTGAVQYAPPPMAAPPISLTPGDQPRIQQIVMRDTVKVNCRFCGALIDSTAQRCPNCGAPRT